MADCREEFVDGADMLIQNWGQSGDSCAIDNREPLDLGAVGQMSAHVGLLLHHQA